MVAIKTKKGAASIYVVAFTTMVLSIIAVSFVRIMVSEVIQTANYDLSQSAYDSALAGVEDAKVALIKYHDCLSQGYQAGTGAGCPQIIAKMANGIAAKSCDTVASVLGRTQDSSGEVMIQESSSVVDNTAQVMDQAYTCVTIEEELNDYRAYLDSANRTRLIPVRTSTPYNSIKGIYFQWYSDNNGAANKFMTDSKLQKNNSTNPWNPPVVTLDLIQTDNIFTLGELSADNGVPSYGTDHAMLVFYPVNSGGVRKISKGDIINVSDKSNNSPIKVNCSGTSADGFHCRTYIELPPTYNQQGNSLVKNDDTFFFRVTLPYGQPSTDFSIYLCTDESCANNIESGNNKSEQNIYNNTTTLTAVQARVDSTGRANDLYRRIETRVELVDTGFPYPEFVMEISEGINKNFWVTKNCWMMEQNGGSTCANSGEV